MNREIPKSRICLLSRTEEVVGVERDEIFCLRQTRCVKKHDGKVGEESPLPHHFL
jgi:hypothetical protein